MSLNLPPTLCDSFLPPWGIPGKGSYRNFRAKMLTGVQADPHTPKGQFYENVSSLWGMCTGNFYCAVERRDQSRGKETEPLGCGLRRVLKGAGCVTGQLVCAAASRAHDSCLSLRKQTDPRSRHLQTKPSMPPSPSQIAASFCTGGEVWGSRSSAMGRQESPKMLLMLVSKDQNMIPAGEM